MYEFIWFMGGALTYKFLATTFSLTQASRVFENLQLEVITFLGAVVEDISFIKALKYKVMQESGLNPEQIKTFKLKDEEFFEIWKKNCIANIHRSVPNYTRLSFHNWEDVIAFLDKIYAGGANEEKQE